MTEKQQQKKTLLPVSTEREASLNTADIIAVGSDAFHVKWLMNMQEAQCGIHSAGATLTSAVGSEVGLDLCHG